MSFGFPGYLQQCIITCIAYICVLYVLYNLQFFYFVILECTLPENKLNWAFRPKFRSSWRNISRNPQVSSFISRPIYNRVMNGPVPCECLNNVKKSKRIQFMNYQICHWGVCGINHFIFSNFIAITIQWVFFSAVSRCSINNEYIESPRWWMSCGRTHGNQTQWYS